MPKYSKKQKAAMRLAEHDLVELLCAMFDNDPRAARQALGDVKDSISILVDTFRSDENERSKISA